MRQQFPGLTLEDKGVLEGGEIDEDPLPRRSQRIAKAQELESEGQILARDMKHGDTEAADKADEDHEVQEAP